MVLNFQSSFQKTQAIQGGFWNLRCHLSAQKVKKVVTLVRARGLRFQPCFSNSFSLKRAGKCVKKVKARGQTQPGLEPAKRTQKTPVNAINMISVRKFHYRRNRDCSFPQAIQLPWAGNQS